MKVFVLFHNFLHSHTREHAKYPLFYDKIIILVNPRRNLFCIFIFTFVTFMSKILQLLTHLGIKRMKEK